MTTLFPETCKCAVCGKTSEQKVIGSTSSIGSCDLDLRPAPPKRYAIHHTVQVCPVCGYVANSISDEVSEVVKLFVCSDEYKKIVSSLPDGHQAAQLAIALKKENYKEAFGVALCAAWICDDGGYLEQAVFYRRKALEIMVAHDEDMVYDSETKVALRADLLRRCGDFEQVILVCDEHCSMDKTISAILEFERYLSAQKDATCHTVSEAVSFYDKQVSS